MLILIKKTIHAWIISGFFSIKVTEPGYEDSPLFEYDVGVDCPKNFDMYFTVPTEGPDDYEKRYQVHIQDGFRAISMIVNRPAPNVKKEVHGRFYTGFFTVRLHTEVILHVNASKRIEVGIGICFVFCVV